MTLGDSWSALGGMVRYEFAMQLRRRALWVVYGLLGVLLFIAYFNGALAYLETLAAPRRDLVVMWASLANMILTAGAALILADRVPRDRTTRVDEVLRTSATSPVARLVGKYLGAVAATLVPITLVYVVSVATLVARWQDIGIIPLALGAFAALGMPSIFFVGAFSIACTTLLWTPLYQVLFVGYWLWTGLNNTSIPTLSGTVLSPFGPYVITGLLGFSTFEPIDATIYPSSSIGLAVANIACLLLCGVLALLGAGLLQRWRTVRE